MTERFKHICPKCEKPVGLHVSLSGTFLMMLFGKVECVLTCGTCGFTERRKEAHERTA